MEWLIGGALPRGSAAGGGQTAEARLEQVEARLSAQQAARRKAQREQEQAVELERIRKTGVQVRGALAAEEATLQAEPGALRKELPTAEPEPTAQGLAERMRQGLAKTRERLVGGLAAIVSGRTTVDRAAIEEVEELLLAADMGPLTTGRLIKALESKLRRDELRQPERLQAALRQEVEAILGREYAPARTDAAVGTEATVGTQAAEPAIGAGTGPVVILFTGVNGTGKTTTIGKLGAQFRAQGKRVLLAAGDTFRAAAAEQLAGWAERAQCDLFRQAEGANPSGVIYQAVEKAQAEGYDVVLCDTAGRLHTKGNLMEELKKIKRVIGKVVPGAPQETYLVLDANNGQNAIHQARDFNEAVGLTGLIVTKLDGTARGGVIVGIVNEFDLPVRYIGVGEGVHDLRPFDAQAFARSLFE